MILLARIDGSEVITHTFEGWEYDNLVNTAIANGCAEWVEADEAPPTGSRLIGGVVHPPMPDTIEVPLSVTATQFITALATPPWSFITSLEAVEIATMGTMPFEAEAAMVALPPSEQLALRVALARAPIIERSHPLVVLFASTRDKTAAEMDAFFSFASTLGG